MRTTTVVVRQLTTSTEATRILDALDAAVDTPSDRLSNGRRYVLSSPLPMPRDEAVALLQGLLDRISGTWPIHVAIAGLE